MLPQISFTQSQRFKILASPIESSTSYKVTPEELLQANSFKDGNSSLKPVFRFVGLIRFSKPEDATECTVRLKQDKLNLLNADGQKIVVSLRGTVGNALLNRRPVYPKLDARGEVRYELEGHWAQGAFADLEPGEYKNNQAEDLLAVDCL